MKTNLKSRSILAGLALALAFVPSVAEAGAYDFGGANCWADKTGSGACVGTLREFRHNPHAEDVARFMTTYPDGSARRHFGARYNGRDYGCTFPSGFSEATWTQLLSNPDLTFAISWTGGVCRLDSLFHDSVDLD